MVEQVRHRTVIVVWLLRLAVAVAVAVGAAALTVPVSAPAVAESEWCFGFAAAAARQKMNRPRPRTILRHYLHRSYYDRSDRLRYHRVDLMGAHPTGCQPALDTVLAMLLGGCSLKVMMTMV